MTPTGFEPVAYCPLIKVEMKRALIEEDTECFIVEEPGALWPQNQKQWSAGEINRVDFGKKGRLFELPSNQGNFDSRVKVLASLVDEASDEHTKVLKIDLGHRNGDFDLSARQRALVDRVYGIDILSSDISNNGTPFNFTKEIQLPLVEKRGYGRPYHIANNYDYGIAVGKVDLEFSQDTMQENASLSKITEQNFPVNDRIESDTSLVHQITKNLDFAAREKGDLMFPAFIDIIEQRPSLENYDKTTKNGRMSKGLWEKFIANVLRRGAPAEVSLVLCKVSSSELWGADFESDRGAKRSHSQSYGEAL